MTDPRRHQGGGKRNEMTNDRELLENAAKAAGYTLREHYTGFPLIAEELNAAWNPLTDDGDALRLAVKLRLCFGPNFHGDRAVCFREDRDDVRELFGNDPLAATRRAIVRAAAEIGRSMK